MARNPVGDHPARKEEEELRQDGDGQNEPEIGGGSVQLEHREGKRDGSHRGAGE